MKKLCLLFVYAAGICVLFAAACSHNHTNTKLIGEWRCKKDGSKLKITDKTFALENDSPDPEDYFVKGDTIYTSFEGNLPYTKYAIKKLDDHQLAIFTPDSVIVEYQR